MAKKIYTAIAGFSITVMAHGRRMHIRFEELSNGRSQFVTSDEDVQRELEARASYGDIFTGAVVDEPVVEAPVEETPAETTVENKKVPVGSLAEAKEYLVQYYGLGRTQLRTKASILKAAGEHNIEFTGIE